MTKETKFFTHEILKVLNASSIKAGRNQNFHFDRLPIKAHQNYPVVLAFEHNGVEMRTEIIFNENGDRGWLDISFEEYEMLPAFTREVSDD